MVGQITVKLSLQWVTERADGEECFMCSDTCFLRVRNLYATVDGAISEKPLASFCAACSDAMASHF